jgi:hypothetical protein
MMQKFQDALAKWFQKQPENTTLTGWKNLFRAGSVVLNERRTTWKRDV